MTVDKEYCMNSFLMFRTIADDKKCFTKELKPNLYKIDFDRTPVRNSNDLENSIAEQMVEFTKDGKAALALSGGIDSAILAKYMPKGSTAYTFQCVVPGVEVVSEVPLAAKYAKECGLKHKIVHIDWEDMETYAPILMKHKGAPIHSIEVQIYIAAMAAKKDGFERLIFGESSDANYGGLSGLMSKDWTYGDFVERYAFVMPYKVLKKSNLILEPYQKYEENGYIDAHTFISNFFINESMGSYVNACECAGIKVEFPYINTKLIEKLDYQRIRKGENKYIVREVFNRLYNGFSIPEKRPMPRAVNEWLKDWKGPVRSEFWPHCTDNMNGDQKWLVYILEKFLDMIEE